MADDYRNAPVSLSIVKAEREENAAIAKPRDILIELLREIDNGLKVDAVVIAYRHGGDPPQRGRANYMQAGAVGLHDALGIMDRVRYLMNKHGD